jgi:hypothetical protein
MPEKYRWRKESGIGCILAVELKLPPDSPNSQRPTKGKAKIMSEKIIKRLSGRGALVTGGSPSPLRRWFRRLISDRF